MNVFSVMGPVLQRGGDADGAGIGIVGGLVQLIVVVYIIACLWMIFQKAGQEGWKSIIPIYNTIVLLQIVGKPWWWILLMLVPLLNFVMLVLVYLELGKSFGKGTMFSVLGLICCAPVGLGILAFGGDRYLGPGGQSFQGGYGQGGYGQGGYGQGGPNYR